MGGGRSLGGGGLRPRSYADARYVDVVIVSKAADTQIPARADNLVEGSTSTVEVVMDRPTLTTSWGFSVIKTASGERVVSSVKDGTSAAGKLHVLDYVQKVNGISLDGLAHIDAINIITSTTQLRVVIQRNGDLPTGPTAVKTVTLVRDPARGFGFSFETDAFYGLGYFGVSTESHVHEDERHFIAGTRKGTPAFGQLFVGDLVDSINGVNAKETSHDDIVDMLAGLDTVEIVVERRLAAGTFTESGDRVVGDPYLLTELQRSGDATDELPLSDAEASDTEASVQCSFNPMHGSAGRALMAVGKVTELTLLYDARTPATATVTTTWNGDSMELTAVPSGRERPKRFITEASTV